VLRTEIQHPPWRIRAAEVQLDENTLASAHRLTVSGKPLAHLSRRQDVLFWIPQRVRRQG
jgi:hypothetical protein